MKAFDTVSPTKLVFPDLSDAEAQYLQGVLTYKDPEVEKELRRIQPKQARLRYIERHGLPAYTEHIENLRGRLNVSLLTGPDKKGAYSTLAGFASRLQGMGFRNTRAAKVVDEDDMTKHAYAMSYKAVKPRYYQTEAADALFAARHAAISLPTGAGKSLVIENLVRRHGVKTVIMAPSRSIASQLHAQLIKAFGKKAVGMFGDGKKESGKDIVVGIAASLTKVVDDQHGKRLREAKLFIADESHLVPASTFGRVCLELLGEAPNRYFVSATQFRNDGTDILLEGITGPVVYSKSLLELVEEGFLARPRFQYWTSESPSRYVGHDWHAMVDKHIYSNAKLAAEAAALANKIRDVKGRDHPILILVDEIRQFKFLLPHLRHEVAFAHGPLNADNRDEVDARFQKSDVDDIVARYNAGEIPILVGTSCITTGTDLRPTGTIIYLMAGASEIRFWQAVGRGTRLVDGKTTFNFIFMKVDIPDVDPYGNVFYRHFKQVHSYCQPFGVKGMGLSQ